MKVFWMDAETSGTDPARHGIISLAYAVEIDGKVKEMGQKFSNCEGKEIDEGALKVNHFTREQVATFPPPGALYADLLTVFGRFVDKYNPADKFYAGGYNVEFDLKFLRQLWADRSDSYFGSWFAFRSIDPSTAIPFLLYAGRLPGFPAKQKLVDVARYFGVEEDTAHDAWSDLRMVRHVAQKVAEMIAPPAVEDGAR